MSRALPPIPDEAGGLAPPQESRIVLAHGGGGQLADELLQEAILPRLGNRWLDALTDAATLAPFDRDRPAFTIDGYVVQPWRFPGGDIGRLAVCGTVNDLAVCGALPVGLALGLILPEGFPRRDLETMLDSAATAAADAGVRVVTGDTKVVARGEADGPMITTAGLGRVPRGRRVGIERIRPGDVLLVNGPIGEHGLAVMLAREMPEVESPLRSDAAPLNGLIEALIRRLGDDVVFMRDPTRGGLAGVAADVAAAAGRRVRLDEEHIPLSAEARHAADMLGLDPLEVANEGKVVVIVRPGAAADALAVLRDHPLGCDAAIIGGVEEAADGRCELLTTIGGRRIVQKPYGEQLPRIC